MRHVVTFVLLGPAAPANQRVPPASREFPLTYAAGGGKQASAAFKT